MGWMEIGRVEKEGGDEQAVCWTRRVRDEGRPRTTRPNQGAHSMWSSSSAKDRSACRLRCCQRAGVARNRTSYCSNVDNLESLRIHVTNCFRHEEFMKYRLRTSTMTARASRRPFRERYRATRRCRRWRPCPHCRSGEPRRGSSGPAGGSSALRRSVGVWSRSRASLPVATCMRHHTSFGRVRVRGLVSTEEKVRTV